jgi:predicted site-specific integrase-resolvase
MELLTQTELCNLLKISKETAFRYRKQGMPYYGRYGGIRYIKEEVLKWLKEKTVK